jgi:hypothetical protein
MTCEKNQLATADFKDGRWPSAKEQALKAGKIKKTKPPLDSPERNTHPCLQLYFSPVAPISDF